MKDISASHISAKDISAKDISAKDISAKDESVNYTFRALTMSDAARLTEIRNAAELVEPTDENYDVDDVVEELGADGVNLPAGSVAVELDGVMVACGRLEASPVTDTWRAYFSGDVDPLHRRRGLGRRISEMLIEQAQALRDAADPTLPIELKMWVADSRLSETALAAAMGFEPARWFFRMGRELRAEIPPIPQIAGVRIRRYENSDSEAVLAVSNEAFADHWGSVAMDQQRWDSGVVGARAFLPELSFVAETTAPDQPAEIIGFSINDEYEAETQARGFRTGWVSRLGVSRSGRGNGVATALMLTSLAAFKSAGYQNSELMVDGDSPTGAGRIYTAVGYRTIDRTTTYIRRLPRRP